MRALDDLVTAGKVRYIGCSNFSGWHIMKAQGIALAQGWAPLVAHQAQYSLVAREYEWELLPVALDRGLGTLAWSPLGGGYLTGKVRRGRPLPEGTRLALQGSPQPIMPEPQLHDLVELLADIAEETGGPSRR